MKPSFKSLDPQIYRDAAKEIELTLGNPMQSAWACNSIEAACRAKPYDYEPYTKAFLSVFRLSNDKGAENLVWHYTNCGYSSNEDEAKQIRMAALEYMAEQVENYQLDNMVLNENIFIAAAERVGAMSTYACNAISQALASQNLYAQRKAYIRFFTKHCRPRKIYSKSNCSEIWWNTLPKFNRYRKAALLKAAGLVAAHNEKVGAA